MTAVEALAIRIVNGIKKTQEILNRSPPFNL
jgi:hypothetical protein